MVQSSALQSDLFNVIPSNRDPKALQADCDNTSWPACIFTRRALFLLEYLILAMLDSAKS
jgi:hypothetical protein